MRHLKPTLLPGAALLTCLALGGCSGNVGMGLSAGIPVGNHGYTSVGTSGWY